MMLVEAEPRSDEQRQRDSRMRPCWVQTPSSGKRTEELDVSLQIAKDYENAPYNTLPMCQVVATASRFRIVGGWLVTCEFAGSQGSNPTSQGMEAWISPPTGGGR